MSQYNQWNGLKDRLMSFGKQITCILIDALFLCLWVAVQWAVNTFVIERLELSSIDKWTLVVFRIIFAVSTLVPVVVYIYTDLRVMFIRVQKRIKEERASDK